MNEKKYVRVQAETSIRGYFSGDHAKEYVPNFDGDLKVVPADAIVIERGDLPEVRVLASRPDYAYVVGQDKEVWIRDVTAKSVRETALRNLALAEHLDAHPPVDEAQVEAMAAVLDAEGRHHRGSATDLARRLVEQGWTKPAVES